MCPSSLSRNTEQCTSRSSMRSLLSGKESSELPISERPSETAHDLDAEVANLNPWGEGDAPHAHHAARSRRCSSTYGQVSVQFLPQQRQSQPLCDPERQSTSLPLSDPQQPSLARSFSHGFSSPAQQPISSTSQMLLPHLDDTQRSAFPSGSKLADMISNLQGEEQRLQAIRDKVQKKSRTAL